MNLDKYKITKNEGNYAYTITGPHGSYWLLRNVRSLTTMFAINRASYMNPTPFDGHLFTDRDGTLRLM